jgi:putative Holliday junction resolvase
MGGEPSPRRHPVDETRILGVDFGDARTGVAVSDPLGLTAQPREVVSERDPARAAERIAQIAREVEVAEIVIGLPVHMSGREGERAKRAREFGALVEEASGLPVTFWDERLTSKQAAGILKGRGARERKAKIDIISAQLILQSFLDARGPN